MVQSATRVQGSRSTEASAQPKIRGKAHRGYAVGLLIAGPVAVGGSGLLSMGLLSGGQGGTGLLWGIAASLLGIVPVFVTALVLAEGES